MSHIIHCDRCPETIEMNAENFGLNWAALTDANDNSCAGRGDPLHLCPGCTKSFNAWAKGEAILAVATSSQKERA